MIRVVVVDDQPVVREGVSAILADDPEFHVIAKGATAEHAIELTERHKPDVVVLDLRLGGYSGTEACKQILMKRPRTRVLGLTTGVTEATIFSAFAAGARGLALKESEPGVLRFAILVVSRGGVYVDPWIAGKLVHLATRGRRTKGAFGLSLQEMRVVALVPGGRTNRQIGRELGISEETVKTHLRNAMRKLGVRGRGEVAEVAVREGLC